MTPNLDELERLAQAATPGPWRTWNDGHVGSPEVHMGGIVMPTPGSDPDQWMPDARFIAATDPTTILALIASLRRVEALIDGPLTWRVIDDERNEQVIRAADLRAALNPKEDQ